MYFGFFLEKKYIPYTLVAAISFFSLDLSLSQSATIQFLVKIQKGFQIFFVWLLGVKFMS